jgi:hypothetical protein
MPRPTRKLAAVPEAGASEQSAKRTKTSGAVATAAAPPSGLTIKSLSVRSRSTKGAASSGGMERGDSAVDLCSFKGNFQPTKMGGKSSGAPHTLAYRVTFTHGSKTISPWHDIPYRASAMTYHMMCEIPKWTRAKFEVATKEVNNPIKQDEKKGVLRTYKHGDMLFNYGFMPQTWQGSQGLGV